MTAIAIRPELKSSGAARFRAVAGEHQSVGPTMGAALDALTADWGDDVREATVLIQRFQPDVFFTEAQQTRMQDLLARRAALTPEERAELELWVDTELDATIARTNRLVAPK